MIHLRTDWQGIQDVRQWLLPELEGLEAQVQQGDDVEEEIGKLIDRIKKLAGVPLTSPSLVHSSIGEDEPVFMVRAKDIVSGDVVRYWAAQANGVGSDPKLVERVHRYAAQMDEYRKAKWGTAPSHAPDAPELAEYEVPAGATT